MQDYPDLREYPDGPPEQPYDAAGWTLPFQMGVDVVTVNGPLSDAFRAALRPVRGRPTDLADPNAPFTTDSIAAGIALPAGTVAGRGDALLVDPTANDAFKLVNRALADGGSVAAIPATGGRGARYAITGVPAARYDALVRELGLRAERVRAAALAAGATRVARRVGIVKPWTASMDVGWTEWLFDQYGVRYTALTPNDVQSGGPSAGAGKTLSDRFDVILIASDAPRTLTNGFPAAAIPAPYAGGLGDGGALALDAFVRAGGTLVALNRGASYAMSALKLPVRDVTAGLDRKQYFASGSILEVTTNAAHPVMAGMPAQANVFVDGSPAFAPLDGFRGTTLASYATSGSPLRSGYLLGERHLQGQAAALDVRHDRGHVILVGFRPQWRGQPIGTFRVVLNSVLFAQPVAVQ